RREHQRDRQRHPCPRQRTFRSAQGIHHDRERGGDEKAGRCRLAKPARGVNAPSQCSGTPFPEPPRMRRQERRSFEFGVLRFEFGLRRSKRNPTDRTSPKLKPTPRQTPTNGRHRRDYFTVSVPFISATCPGNEQIKGYSPGPGALNVTSFDCF